MTGFPDLPPGVAVRTELRPGDLGGIIALHGTLYAAEYGWDRTFETYVAGPLTAFVDAVGDRERLWVVTSDDAVAGSIAIVQAAPDVAQLRWYLLHPALRGLGIGRALADAAIAFCRDQGYGTVFLWTVDALAAAAAVYRGLGFRVTAERENALWGMTVLEQRYDLRL